MHRAVDLIPVLLGLFVLLAPLLTRPGFTSVGVFLVLAFGLTLVAVVTATTLKAAQVWAGHPAFPSSHMSFVVTMSVFLVFWDTRWLVPATLVCLVQAIVLRAGHFHTVPEIIGGTALGLLLGVPVAGSVARARARGQGMRV